MIKNLVVITNGKRFPVLEVVNGVYVCQSSYGVVQWVNLQVEENAPDYEELLVLRKKETEEYSNRPSDLRKPTCKTCNKEFDSLITFHQHWRKCS